MEFIIPAGAALVALVVGYLVGAARQRSASDAEHGRLEAEARERADALETEARKRRDELVREAESDADEQRRSARSEADELRRDAEREADDIRQKAEREAETAVKERKAELDKLEERLTRRESKLDARAEALDAKQSDIVDEEKELQRTRQSIEDKTRNLKEREAELSEKLEKIAELSRDEARQHVIEEVSEEARLEAARAARRIEEEVLEEADKRAKKILAVAIQRYAGEFVAERCVSVVNLPSDDMKGRVIGREGRNIRALEAATGADFIVDDTPEAVIVSCFDPVRREIARLSAERLVADGRIHPTRIEEVVNKTRKEMDATLKEAGEAAAFELGLTGLHPEIIRTLGRLKFRTSYGQNMWSHSIEVGYLCGLMAGELGLNVKIAQRAGLLHDIGKALDHEVEGGHAIIGGNLCKKYGEDDLVVNAVAAHHEEVKPASVIAHLVIAADAMSGARPGARREILESYVKRLEDLERISASFNGVDKSFAIQAGREIRVIVSNQQVSDDEASLLSREIAKKIEEELTYPGQIKVTVIRETRATEFAR